MIVRQVKYDNTAIVKRACPFCSKEFIKVFNLDQFKAWQRGTLIQRAMPTTSADDREFLITGICADCFPKDDEDE